MCVLLSIADILVGILGCVWYQPILDVGSGYRFRRRDNVLNYAAYPSLTVLEHLANQDTALLNQIAAGIGAPMDLVILFLKSGGKNVQICVG